MRIVDVYRSDVVDEPCPEGFLHTGEVMEIAYDKGRKDELIRKFYVLRGKYTPKFEVRDCGDHYIKANFQTFDWIDKNTFEIIKDVQDE